MKLLVIAPHPDDEVLGAGGTMLRFKQEGFSLAWLVVTSISNKLGWSLEDVARREDEIKKISQFFKFDKVYNLRLETTKLDTLPISEIIQKISNIIEDFHPTDILIPHAGDIHTDHKIVHHAALSSVKWFRHPCVKKVLSYETISETDFGLDSNHIFTPNVFIDITSFLNAKVAAMMIYSSEFGAFPFPRSKVSIESLARYRGSSSGFEAAEAFQLLRERI